MLDALNSIVEFLNMIFQSVVDFISGSELLLKFVSIGSGFLTTLFVLIPVQFMPFVVITVVLSVFMFVVNRSNNS